MNQQDFALNHKAWSLCEEIASSQDELQVERHTLTCGTTVFDFTSGNEQAGILLARVCLADLAEVHVEFDSSRPQIHVGTHHPLVACMASQYAGWEVKGAGFFAMGSGPMRAAAAREELFKHIGFQEQAEQCVGVLETDTCPTDDICRGIAAKCNVSPDQLMLLYAPTNSLAGTMQVVARSVEASLHKLHALGFDLTRVQQGKGWAPIPPIAGDVLAAIGRSNDAILYGAEVTLGITGDDASLERTGSQLPSSTSTEYGRPFVDIMANYSNDFYQIDPLLFSAASITLENLDTGSSFQFGQLNPTLISQSFDN